MRWWTCRSADQRWHRVPERRRGQRGQALDHPGAQPESRPAAARCRAEGARHRLGCRHHPDARGRDRHARRDHPARVHRRRTVAGVDRRRRCRGERQRPGGRDDGQRWGDTGQQALVKALLATGKPVVVVSVGGPYDLAYLGAAPTYLAAYGYQPPTLTQLVAVLFAPSPRPPAGDHQGLRRLRHRIALLNQVVRASRRPGVAKRGQPEYRSG